MRPALTWIVLVILLSVFELLAGQPGTPAFALSAFTLAFGTLAALILAATAWLLRLSRGPSRASGRSESSER